MNIKKINPFGYLVFRAEAWVLRLIQEEIARQDHEREVARVLEIEENRQVLAETRSRREVPTGEEQQVPQGVAPSQSSQNYQAKPEAPSQSGNHKGDA